MTISNVFKFTEAYKGADGHQIGRKVGDALELLTYSMIEHSPLLSQHLVIENGIEGATGADHHVEFSFYKLDSTNRPSESPDDLFGLIECKKVGVECTINNSFKLWRVRNRVFHQTQGYEYKINSPIENYKWRILISPYTEEGNLLVKVDYYYNTDLLNSYANVFDCQENERLIIAIDVLGTLTLLSPQENLMTIDEDLYKCQIVTIKNVSNNNINDIIIEDCLCGPQTPEKAKQCSFVSLDVRKRVLGHFDKFDEDCHLFNSIVVIGEFSHWENKSQNMIKLCNDYNLYVPDDRIVKLMSVFQENFGNHFLEKITKNLYRTDMFVKQLTDDIVEQFNFKILKDIRNNRWVKFDFDNSEDIPKLIVTNVE